MDLNALFGQAEQAYHATQIITIEPKNANAFYNREVSKKALGDDEGANEVF